MTLMIEALVVIALQPLQNLSVILFMIVQQLVEQLQGQGTIGRRSEKLDNKELETLKTLVVFDTPKFSKADSISCPELVDYNVQI